MPEGYVSFQIYCKLTVVFTLVTFAHNPKMLTFCMPFQISLEFTLVLTLFAFVHFPFGLLLNAHTLSKQANYHLETVRSKVELEKGKILFVNIQIGAVVAVPKTK